MLFAPVSRDDLARLEQNLNRQIPGAYREFLLGIGNGLNLFSGTLSLDGLRASYARSGDAVWQPFDLETVNSLERPRNALADYFYIGGYFEDGSHLYLDGERVYRCSRDSAKQLNHWNSLSEMMIQEVTRISRLFDEKGRRKELNH